MTSKKSAEQTEHEKRSEAAKKAAQTRAENAEREQRAELIGGKRSKLKKAKK